MANNKLHVKKGDTVVVIAGKDKGKKGKILQAMPAKSRVVVEGVNIIKKHTRPTQKMPQGGIVEKKLQSMFPMSCLSVQNVVKVFAFPKKN